MLALVLGPQRRCNTVLFSRSLKISVQLARCALFDPSIVGMSPDRSEIFDSNREPISAANYHCCVRAQGKQ